MLVVLADLRQTLHEQVFTVRNPLRHLTQNEKFHQIIFCERSSTPFVPTASPWSRPARTSAAAVLGPNVASYRSSSAAGDCELFAAGPEETKPLAPRSGSPPHLTTSYRDCRLRRLLQRHRHGRGRDAYAGASSAPPAQGRQLVLWRWCSEDDRAPREA